MAVDREYRIRISTVSESGGAKESTEALQDVGKASEKAADGLKESAKAADESSKAKKQLKSVIEGLKEKFPELAHVAKLALNPVAFIVAGITGAFAIWNKRIEETTRVLAGLELPDIKEDNIGHINANAEAWERYSQAVEKTKEAYTSAAAQSDRLIANIQRELQLNKEWIKSIEEVAKARLEAMKTELTVAEYERKKAEIGAGASKATQGEEEQAAQDTFAAQVVKVLDYRAAAAAKRGEASGIKIGKGEDDEQTLKKLEDAANAAEKDLKERQDRRIKLQDYASGQGSYVESLWVKMQQILTGMSVAEMIDLESQGEETDRSIINNYRRFKGSVPGRSKLRSRREDLLAGAAEDEGKAAEIEAGLPGEEATMAAGSAASHRNEILRQLAEAYKALAQVKEEANRLQKEAMDAADSGRMVGAAIMSRLQELTNANRELQQRIATLERRQGS